MKRLFAVAVASAVLSLCTIAHAKINIETVAVGDAGNAADTTGYGTVHYTYHIGKYEVTAGQYTAFLNAVAKTDTYGLYDANMDTAVDLWGCNIKRSGLSGSYIYTVASDWANRPVNWVSYWDACRFANWMHNAQRTGLQTAATTERGTYILDGYNSNDGRNIYRIANGKFAVTAEDEWYKAAYYKGGGINAGYWDYPMQSDDPTVPSNDITNPDGGNNANFSQNGNTIGSPYWRTEVGEFENSESAYGTFDQGGNVWEWNEGIPFISGNFAHRGRRGGSFGSNAPGLRESPGFSHNPAGAYVDIGFRITLIPEPSSLIVLSALVSPLLAFRRRKG